MQYLKINVKEKGKAGIDGLIKIGLSVCKIQKPPSYMIFNRKSIGQSYFIVYIRMI